MVSGRFAPAMELLLAAPTVCVATCMVTGTAVISFFIFSCFIFLKFNDIYLSSCFLGGNSLTRVYKIYKMTMSELNRDRSLVAAHTEGPELLFLRRLFWGHHGQIWAWEILVVKSYSSSIAALFFRKSEYQWAECLGCLLRSSVSKSTATRP